MRVLQAPAAVGGHGRSSYQDMQQMDYDDATTRGTMILVADRPADIAHGRRAADATRLDVVRVIAVADVAEADLNADLVFVEIGMQTEASAFDILLDRLGALTRLGRAVAISVVPELIDLTMGRLGQTTAETLCSPTDVDRMAAIHMLLTSRVTAVREDGPADRLRSIGDELAQIAQRLVGMADDGFRSGVSPAIVPVGNMRGEAVVAEEYRRIIRGRRLRDQFLGADLFADPAWDMLLDLAAARIDGHGVAVSSLCIAAAVPPTTALRWIRALTDRGIMVRTPDPQDGRRVFMALSDATARAMDAYVRAIGADA